MIRFGDSDEGKRSGTTLGNATTRIGGSGGRCEGLPGDPTETIVVTSAHLAEALGPTRAFAARIEFMSVPPVDLSDKIKLGKLAGGARPPRFDDLLA
jgi:hypothetical protein